MKKLQSELEIRTWEKISETINLTIEHVYTVDGRRLVSRRDLCRLWGVSDEAIKSYTKKGLPKSELSHPSMSVYDYDLVTKWRAENVDLQRGRAKSKARADAENGFVDPSSTVVEDTHLHTGYAIRQMIAESDKAVETAKLAKLKRQELEGSLVESETLDIALAELAVIYSTTYVNDKKLLPIQLKNKTDGEIRKFLDQHYANRMSDLNILINKSFETSDSIYDVLEVIIDKLNNGSSPKEIIDDITIRR